MDNKTSETNVLNEFELARQLDAVLKGHSNRVILDALKMVAAKHNLKVTSAFAPTTQAIISKGNKTEFAKAKPANKSPAVLQLKVDLKTKIDEIKKKTIKEGSSLDEFDPLIVEKKEILAKIAKAKGSFLGKQEKPSGVLQPEK